MVENTNSANIEDRVKDDHEENYYAGDYLFETGFECVSIDFLVLSLPGQSWWSCNFFLWLFLQAHIYALYNFSIINKYA